MHIVVYSHGFGVRRDDRGLFTDIAAALPSTTHRMFDYNQVDEAANTMTVEPLEAQAQKLLGVIGNMQREHPSAAIDLICHSQGCVVAALAHPTGIRKSIFIAPPKGMLDTERRIKEICAQHGIAFTQEDVIRLPRRDGSTTIIPPAYWRAPGGLDAQDMYSTFAEITDLTIITATEDEVLGVVVFDRLSPRVKLLPMTAGHNFEGPARPELVDIITGELKV